MLKILIDGGRHSGGYRVTCECGDMWTGQGAPDGVSMWSPALAVAEAVVHMKTGHQGLTIDLSFTPRFDEWLVAYWQRQNQRQPAVAIRSALERSRSR